MDYARPVWVPTSLLLAHVECGQLSAIISVVHLRKGHVALGQATPVAHGSVLMPLRSLILLGVPRSWLPVGA